MPGKPPAEKMLLKPGQRIRLINAPENVDVLLGSLPAGVELLTGAASADALLPADILVLFAQGRTDLVTLLPGLRTALAPGGIIWVAYHKGTSRVQTDINRDSIAAYAQTIGLAPVALVAINDDWSALRLKPTAQ